MNLQSLSVFEYHKGILLRMIALVSVIALILMVPLSRRTLRSFFGSPLARALAAFIAVNVLSTLFSLSPGVALRGEVFRFGGLATLLASLVLFLSVWLFLRSAKAFRLLLQATVWTSIPVCLYGLSQYFGIDPLSWSEPTRDRIASTLGNPIFLGAYLIMVFFPTLAEFLRNLSVPKESGAHEGLVLWRAMLYGSAALLQLLVLWFTQSRGPFLALAFGLVLTGMILWRFRRHWKDSVVQGGRIRAVICLMGSGIAGGLAPVVATGFLPGGPHAPWWLFPVLGCLSAVLFFLGTIRSRAVSSALPAWMFTVALILLFALGFGLRSRTVDFREVPELFSDAAETAQQTALRAGTVRERIDYWEAYVNGIFSDPPMRAVPVDPETEPVEDSLHSIRFLIGFGREQGAAVFRAHYPSSMAPHHAPTESADRAHNLGLDLMLSTGIAGIAVFLLLFQRILTYGLASLGFRMDRTRRRRLVVSLWGGAGTGAGGAIVLFGLPFIGVGIHVGFLAGLAAFVLFAPVRRLKSSTVHGVWFPLVGLLVSLAVHWAETAVSLEVMASRTLFWVFAGALAAVAVRGVGLRQADESSSVASGSLVGEVQGREQSSAGGLAQSVSTNEDASRATVFGILLALACGTMTFSFVQAVPGLKLLPEAAQLVYAYPHEGSSLGYALKPFLAPGHFPMRAKTVLFYVGLLLLPVLWGGFAASLESGKGGTNSSAWIVRALRGVLSTAVLGFLAFCLLKGAHHVLLGSLTVSLTGSGAEESARGILRMSRLGSLSVVVYAAWVILCLLAAAWSLSRGNQRGFAGCAGTLSRVGFGLGVVFFGVCSWFWCIQPARADMLGAAGSAWRRGIFLPQDHPEPRVRRIVWRTACSLFEEQVRLAPGFAQSQTQLSLVYWDAVENLNGDSREDFEEGPEQLENASLEALRRARALEPYDPVRAFYFYGFFDRRISRAKTIEEGARATRSAMLWLQTTRKLFPVFPYLETEHVAFLFKSGAAPEEVIRAADHVLKLNSQEIKAYRIKAEALLNKFRASCGHAAANPLEGDVEGEVRLSYDWDLMGPDCRGLIEEASHALDRAVALRPRLLSDVYLQSVRLLLAQDREEKALQVLKAGLAVHPDSLPLIRALAGAARYHHDSQLGEAVFTELQASHPLEKRLVLGRADYRWALGDKEGAVEVLESVLSDDPEDAAFNVSAVKYLVGKGWYEEAMRYVESMLGTNPRSFEAFALAARAAGETGDLRLEMRLMLRALQLPHAYLQAQPLYRRLAEAAGLLGEEEASQAAELANAL